MTFPSRRLHHLIATTEALQLTLTHLDDVLWLPWEPEAVEVREQLARMISLRDWLIAIKLRLSGERAIAEERSDKRTDEYVKSDIRTENLSVTAFAAAAPVPRRPTLRKSPSVVRPRPVPMKATKKAPARKRAKKA